MMMAASTDQLTLRVTAVIASRSNGARLFGTREGAGTLARRHEYSGRKDKARDSNAVPRENADGSEIFPIRDNEWPIAFERR